MREHNLHSNRQASSRDITTDFAVLEQLQLVCEQEYISSKSVQLLKTAFLHIDVTSASVNPISGGTSCTYVNHSLHRSLRQTNHIQPVPFKGPDSVVDS